MHRPLPRALWVLSLVVLVVCSVMTLAGAWTTSASLDEAFHVQRMQHFLDDGWFLIDRQMVGGQPAEGVADRYVYGPVTMLFLHGLAMVWGVEDPGVISASADAYAVRHVGIALIGLVGVAAAICIGRLVLSSWRWGLFVGAVLVSTPMWTGHLMMNPKDVSVATGYTVLTLGLMLLTVSSRQTWRHRLVPPILVTLGIFLAIGTRPGIWAGVAASLVTFVVIQIIADLRSEAGNRRWGRYAGLGGSVALAGVALAAVYPAIFTHPVAVVVQSTGATSQYDGASNGAWWYIPIAVAISVPILVIVLSLIGAAGTVRLILAVRTRPTGVTTRLALTLMQAFTLPVVAMLVEAKLYNGVRHFLFVMPAIAVLAAVGVIALLSAEAKRPRVLSAVVTALVMLGVLAPTVDQVRLFPYNYTYFNEVADAAGIEGQTDWWWTSARQLAQVLPPTEYAACVRELDPEGVAHPQWIDLQTNCATSDAGTLAPYASERAGLIDPPLSELEFLAVSTEVVDEPENCQVLHEVTRPVRFGEAVMGRVARCELRPPTYGGGIDLPAEPGVVSMLDGWRLPKPDESGIVLEYGRGRIAIAVPDAWRGSSVNVALRASRTEALSSLRVNGVEQTWTVAADGERIVFDVPQDVAADFGDGRLVFSFLSTEADGGDGLRLLSLEMSSGPGPSTLP